MKKIMTMFVVVCLLSSVLMGCGAVKSEETFTTFDCEDGGFSIDFPGEPKHEVQTAQLPIGNIDMHMYMLEKDHMMYMCVYNDYPEEFMKSIDTNELLLNAANGAVSTTNSKNVNITDIKLGEYPGKELTCEKEEKGEVYKMHSKVFLVDNRMYQVNVATDNGDEHKEEMNKFFDSFKLSSQE